MLRVLTWIQLIVMKHFEDMCWDVPILVRYRVSLTTAAVLASSLAGAVQSVGDKHPQVPYVLQLLSHDAAPIVDDVDQGNVARIPLQQHQLDYCRHVAVLLVCTP
jgi:hypothetical protein